MKITKFFNITAAMLVCVLATAATSCDGDDEPETSGLKFNPAIVEIASGNTATVTVKGGTNPFTITVKDTKVASATIKDEKITVKGEKAGKTSITVTDKNKKKGTISVTVK